MAAMALAALGLLGFSLGLRVVVEGSCPSAAAVEAQLRPLLPSGVPLDGLTAHIEPLDELMRVEVRGEDGALLTVRDHLRLAPCDALAAFAAVVIASTVAILPRAAPEPLPPPPPPSPPPPPPPPPPRVLWELGLGAVLAMNSQSLTGGGTLDAQLAPLDRRLGGRLGIRLAATAVALRHVAIDPSGAGADWTRLQLLLAGRYRLRWDRPLVDFYAGVTGAAVLVQGSGFAQSFASRALDVGVAGGLRVGHPWSRLALWGELGVVGWLRPQELLLVGQPAVARLPSWDILLAAGMSVGRLRP